MTAINAYAKGRLGLLLTDTAYYDALGVVGAFGRKAVALNDLRMAIAVRGDSRLPAALALELGRAFDNFDDFLTDGQEFLTGWYEEIEPALDTPGVERHFDLVVVGWSEARGSAEAYALSSFDHRTHGGNIAPFALVRHDYIIAPSLPAVLAGGPLHGDPATILAAMIDRQRQAPQALGTADNAPRAFIVGGEAVLMEVSRAGISQRVLRTWPDKAGERIEPHDRLIENSPAPEACTMNRQQRRAAERAARRAA